jgi:hypothetical protein
VFAHVLVALAAATTTLPAKGEIKPVTAAEQVRVAALPVATRVGAKLGRPSCPSGVPNRVGATFQCTVAVGDAVVPFLVRVGDGATLSVTQAWAVAPSASVIAAAGPKAKCGGRKVHTGPVGSVVNCTVAGSTVKVRFTSLGSVARV